MMFEGWNAETVRRAVALWEEGLSASQIASKLGTTRNAVIGLTHRRRDLFARRRSSAPRPVHLPSRKFSRKSSPPRLAKPRPARPVARRAATTLAFEDADPVAFIDLKRGQCRMPVGDTMPGPAMLCCGRPVIDPFAVPGKREASHCPHCLEISTGTGTRSERNAERLFA